MQSVVHQYRNKSRVFGLIEGLYKYVSDTENLFDDILWLDFTFKPLCDILQEHLLSFSTPPLKSLELPQIEHQFRDTKEVIVCLSGGKDSAATAFYYKSIGYTVHLYHAAGVNKAYGDEKKAAQKVADYLGCDLFIDTIQLAGTHQFIEHPMKNFIIANGAIHYALAMGYKPVIAFGNFKKSTLDMNEFEVCGGDCIEMWGSYKTIIRKVLPCFDLELPLETNADTFRILSHDWQLFSMSISCMSPYRFREHWKHRTENKYNVKLFENRCGCCWKCCLECIWLMDFGHTTYDEEFYMHCVDILSRTIYKETGQTANCIEDIWSNYVFYPIEDSQAYQKLMQFKIPKKYR